MLRVGDAQHLALTQEPVVVLLSLGIEAGVMVGVPGLRAGGRALQRLVEAADAALTGIPVPIIVTAIGLLITKANNSLAAFGLRRQHGIKAEEPQAVGLLEVRIDRRRLNLDAADQVITGVVAYLIILDHVVGLVASAVYAFAVIKAQVVVVGQERAEDVVPHDLVGDLRIVGVDERKRLAGNVANEAAIVMAETDLRGILLGGVFVRRRPIDFSSRDNFHRHAVDDFVIDAGCNDVFDFRSILRRE